MVASLLVDVFVLFLIHSGVLSAALFHSILFLGTEYIVIVAYRYRFCSLLGGCFSCIYVIYDLTVCSLQNKAISHVW